MLINLKDLGARCKRFRVEQGYFQTHVAEETGYTPENISAFETGRNDNSRILLWYIEHGMTLDEIKGLTPWEPSAPVFGIKCERFVKNGKKL